MTIKTLRAGQLALLGTLDAWGTGQIAAHLDTLRMPDAPPARLSPGGRPIGRSSVFRGVTRHDFPSLDVAVFGQGEIGDKARQLILKTAEIRASGFHTPQRYVIGQSLIDQYCHRNGFLLNLRDAVNQGVTYDQVRKWNFTMELQAVVEQIAHAHRGGPLMVRSSGQGDARGTGILRSRAVQSTPCQTRSAVSYVIRSYFSDEARAFRKAASLDHGFGILIEPMIAQNFGGRYAPLISGFGYSSTAKNDGYIVAVPGIGGGVETRDGLTITHTDCKRHEGNLAHVMEQGKERSRIPALAPAFFDALYDARMFGPGEHHWSIDDARLRWTDQFQHTDLRPLFDGMKRLERRFGMPQYFEWALTEMNNEPRWSILQIADVSTQIDTLEFGIMGEEIVQCNEVTNTGVKQCTKTVICTSEEDIAKLKEFNEENEGYIMLYSGKLVTRRDSDRPVLTFDMWSNAGVVIEIPDEAHTLSAVGHMGGTSAMTGKLFGVMDRISHESILWKWYQKQFIRGGGFDVLSHPLFVIADERRDRLVLVEQP